MAAAADVSALTNRVGALEGTTNQLATDRDTLLAWIGDEENAAAIWQAIKDIQGASTVYDSFDDVEAKFENVD